MSDALPPPWTPTVHPFIQSKLEAAEASLAAGLAQDALSAFAKVFDILEEDDPVDPSFVKAHVLSRKALARAQLGQAEAGEEVRRCRGYLQQWDAPDGLYWLSVCFTAGQVQRLLGHPEAARKDLETLWHDLKKSRDNGAIRSLLRATAAELASLGAPRSADEVPEKIDQAGPRQAVALPSKVDFVFHPRFSHRLHIGPVRKDGNTYSGADGSAAWFNPHSDADLKLLMSRPAALLETDDPQVLASLAEARYHPHNQFVLYQPWREPLPDSTIRLVGAMVPAMARPVGESLAKSPVTHFFLITGGVFKGALGALKEGLDGHQLETLGIVWHFTGDDITDVPTMVEEIADLCQACAVQQLSLVTAAFNAGIEQQMLQHFAGVPSLRRCSVFAEDRSATYSRYKTPKLDALLSRRSPPGRSPI